jgi:hypothetical protein
MTLKGSLKIDINGDLHNSGSFLVNHASDTMEIGPLSSGSLRGVINGAGNFKAENAGTLKIGRMAMAGSPDAWEGTITASGGTFHLTEYVTAHLGYGNVQLNNGGTIKVDALWISQGAPSRGRRLRPITKEPPGTRCRAPAGGSCWAFRRAGRRCSSCRWSTQFHVPPPRPPGCLPTSR